LAKEGLTNFQSSINTLREFLREPIVNDRDKAGIIQAFKYTFEQCWKALQQEAASQGVTVASPKQAFSFSLQSGLIENRNEKLWLEMLEDRNLTIHTYKKELADQVIERIRAQYAGAFDGLFIKLS
jgi:nucleotidyltransferase substrate binding protein (TIGR01987 family)